LKTCFVPTRGEPTILRTEFNFLIRGSTEMSEGDPSLSENTVERTSDHPVFLSLSSELSNRFVPLSLHISFWSRLRKPTRGIVIRLLLLIKTIVLTQSAQGSGGLYIRTTMEVQ
jgi:hypothetical protein